MIVKPSDIAPKDRYKLQIGSVLPRLDRLGEFDRSGRKLEPGSLLILYGGCPVADDLNILPASSR